MSSGKITLPHECPKCGKVAKNETELRVSQYLHLKNTHKSHKFLGNKILSLNNYYDAFLQSDMKFNQDYLKLLEYTKELNDLLHTKKNKRSPKKPFN